MFYIAEINYVGPNPESNADSDTIEIRTQPLTDTRGRERIEGNCGTYNDWTYYALGEFDTLEESKAEINEIFGDVRDVTDDEKDPCDETTIKIYKPGKYEKLNREQTEDWAYEGFSSCIFASTTDEEIDNLVLEHEEAANEQGWTLDKDWLHKIMIKYRDSLREEAKSYNWHSWLAAFRLARNNNGARNE
jgi:hypothetical protein